jgi:glycosyltransferase involved in cell wall biosynthesis
MSRDLVVLSHLRWVFVWQRPQHLISRIGAGYDRTWFVEEPLASEDVSEPILRVEEHDEVVRLWLEVPSDWKPAGFDAAALEHYARELPQVIGTGGHRTVWLYTPMALDVARALRPSMLVYDVMDDLAAFKFAPPALLLRQRQALREADLVFTGGRSLHRGVLDHRPNAHCFPSGVEPEHYAPAVTTRAERPNSTPVAGYVGVIDERLDLDLLAGLAEALPDWEVRVVGPVSKIDTADLPQSPNLTYPGPRPYAELPQVMAGFDVALMPFALNEATRSISPTKTLEYLAAGLPVVSTRVPDVVADYDGIVHLREGSAGFAQACRTALAESAHDRAERVRPILRAQHWDAIAARMAAQIDGVSAARETA